MNKTIEVIPVKTAYSIKSETNNTASIELSNGLSGLINTKTKEVIGKLDYYTNVQTKRIGQKEIFILIKGSTISIYDTSNSEFFIKGWQLAKEFLNNFELMMLKNPEDETFHLYDEENCYSNSSIFNQPIENAQVIHNGSYKTCLGVTINGKKALYMYSKYYNDRGFKTKAEYDEIKVVADHHDYTLATIYTKGDKKCFAYSFEPEKLSKEYDEINIVGNNNTILICKNGTTTEVYDISSPGLLFSSNDEIEWICSSKDIDNQGLEQHFFSTQNGGKYGVIKTDRTGSKVEIILKNECDYFLYDKDKIYLSKEGKQGLYDCYYNCLINAEYDNLIELKGNTILLEKNGLWTIGKINSKDFNPDVTDCEILELVDDKIIFFRKNGKMGLVYLEHAKESFTDFKTMMFRHLNNIVVEAAYDNIIKITKEYYLVEQNHKKGILRLDPNFHQGVLVVPVEYDEIEIGFDSKLEKTQALLLSLNKGGQKELMKLNLDSQSYKPLSTIHKGPIDSIEYLPDILVIKNQNHTYVYDYRGGLLETFPTNTMICWNGENAQTKEQYYLVNDKCYSYDTDCFEEIKALMLDTYVVRYETQDCTYQIMGYNEEEYKCFCEGVDSLSDEKAEEYLYGLSKNGMPHEYPRLTLKRVEGKK